MTDKTEQSKADQSKKKKQTGRPRKGNYLEWDEARAFIRSELIPSRGKFMDWYEHNQPKTIPRFPYRVYKEWISWNDFLGTNNEFNQKNTTKWRPFLEAVAFAHPLKLKTQAEWMEWCRIEGNRPADIPAHPEITYKDWRSWMHWLGSKPVEALEAQKEIQRIQVYYILREQGVPGNILTFGVEPMGLTALKQRWDREQFEIIKLFWYEPSKGNEVTRIVQALSSSYQGYERERIVPNVWEIIYHLQMTLDQVTKEQMVR